MTAALAIRDYDPRALGAECDRCPLKDRDPVPPAEARGGRPKLVIVGMNPGTLEENQGVPFIGPSGRLLDVCLDEAGFDRRDAHITNAALCRSNDDLALKRAVPCCAPRLATELAPFKDVPILALGAEACRPLLGKGAVMKTRGFVWTAPEIADTSIRNCERNLEKRVKLGKNPEKIENARDSLAVMRARKMLGGRHILPSVHPAMILRGADGWLPVLRIDVKRAVRFVAGEGLIPRAPGFLLEDRVPFTKTSHPDVARRLLAKMGPRVCVDIETDGNEPMVVNLTCVGICDVDHIEAYAAGRTKLDRSKVVILDPWQPQLLPVLAEAVARREVLTHNGPAFDEIVLKRYGVRYRKRNDTLIAHYSFASDKPKSLAFVASIYNDSSPWKTRFKSGDDEKGVAGFGVRKEDLAAYNAADIVEDSLAWVRMQSDLAVERRVYEHDMRHALLCQKMQTNGLLVDTARRAELSDRLKKRSGELLASMRKLLRRARFSPAKPNDIRKALFQQLKTPVYLAKSTPTGLAACNAELFERLKKGSNRAAKLAALIVDWRKANDINSEYLVNIFVAPDGRVHPHWRSYGTQTGRPATHKPNVLNIPRIQYCGGCGLGLIDGMTHADGCNPAKRSEPMAEYQARDIYVAAPGHVFVYFDLSQAEMRFAANLSGDQAFIAACGKDVHAGNARVLFRAVPGALELLEDPKGKGKKFRDIAKNCGFAIVYLAEADKLYVHLLEHGFDIELETCQDAIDNVRSTYWRYFQYVDENIAICQKQGYLRTAFLGRKRWLGHHPKPTDVSNFPIQSGVADVMNERLAIIDRRMDRRVKHVLYQYDSAIYEVPEDRVEAHEKLIDDVWSEEIFVPHTGKTFKQPIDRKRGRRWSDFG